MDLKAYTLLLLYLILNLQSAQANFICTGQTIYYKAKQVDVVAPPKKNGKPDYQAAKKTCREAVKASKDGFICTGQSIYRKDQYNETLDSPEACRKIIASLDSVVKKMECEEVYETYAICNGIRYNVDLSIKDTLSRDVKTIINRSPLEKDGTSTINK